MYINGQKWKLVSQKRIRTKTKKNFCCPKINWWGWSLGNKPFHPLNFRSSNIINILLVLNWVWGSALWPMDHNCPVAYEPHLLHGLWTTTALWPMDHTCPVAHEPELVTVSCSQSYRDYRDPQHAIYQVPIGTERVKSRAGITQHKYTQLEFIN